MSTLSLEWLKHFFERCLSWPDSGVRVAVLDDLRLADELLDFGEDLEGSRR